jgi:hypothetical protein
MVEFRLAGGIAEPGSDIISKDLSILKEFRAGRSTMVSAV